MRQKIRQIKELSLRLNFPLLVELEEADAFQEEEWPDRIDDPLPGGADSVRIAAAVMSLNSSLSRIRFPKDGTGEGVSWSVLPER